MPKIIDLISDRLGERNLIPLEIYRFVKDVSNVVDGQTRLESGGLKTALQKLGWEERLLDYRTLELICLLLEDQRGFEIYGHNVL